MCVGALHVYVCVCVCAHIYACMWQETQIMTLQQFLASAWLATVIIRLMMIIMITVITYLIHLLT